MQLKIVTMSLYPSEEEMETLNHFLRAHKVIECRKDLVVERDVAAWAFCITYQDASDKAGSEYQAKKGKKVDYREVLSDEDFRRFTELRSQRKVMAEEVRLPAYSVFTDAELAEIAKLSEITEATLKTIPGIGEKRIEKYGKRLVLPPKAQKDEASGVFD